MERKLRIDTHVLYHFLLIDVSRKLLDYCLQESVRFAWFHEHPHYGELSLVIFMNEMDFHGILLAVHGVLAWAVKVKLDELILFAMNLYGALSIGVDL